MKPSIHLIIPMAGKGSRFTNGGFEIPKPLISIYGKPMFYWAIQSIKKNISIASLNIVVLNDHIVNFNIDKIILDLFPEAKIQVLPEVTKGAVITCLNGVEYINDNEPIVFNDCDHYFYSSKFYNFFTKKVPENLLGLLLTFKSNSPNYSYIKYNTNDEIINIVEKQVISDDAICGCYYFINKLIFTTAAKKYISNSLDKEYYMSGVYNLMIKMGQVNSFSTDFHVPCGTPIEYENALKSNYYQCLM
jgi:dTDP-glucose pyrophosphorylase